MGTSRALADTITGLIEETNRLNAALAKAIENRDDKQTQSVQSHMILKELYFRVAWCQAAETLCTAVAEMNKHALQNPRLFSFASERSTWPIIASPGKHFTKGHATEDEIFRSLKVGERTMFKVIGSQSKPNDDLGREAMDMLNRIANRNLFFPPLDELDPAAERKADRRFKQLCRKLPKDFQADGAITKYLAVAKWVFEWRWNNPHERDRLAGLCTNQSKVSLSDKKSAVWRDIKQRFISMAGHNKVRG